MRARASSSTRCFAATCSDGVACCSVQPPHTPKCGQRGTTRSAAETSTRTARATSHAGLRLRISMATVSPGSAPSTKTALPSTRATPRPS
jgi:hypothetical protein